MMASLPEDIIISNILTRLPVKSLSRFRCVCKSWFNLFTDPNFVKLQLNHSLKYPSPGILFDCSYFNICYVDYDSVSSAVSSEVIKIDYPTEYKKYEILGVCNGLICYRTVKDDIIIWNPYTKDYRKLPTPPESIGITTLFRYGFGYDARTEDYKFASLVNCASYSASYSELNVYSLGTDSWKTMVINIPFVYRFEQLVLFNGIFHWVESPSLASGLPRVIGSFDLESETLKEIQLPQELSDRYKFSALGLRHLESCLYLIGSIYSNGVEVWMMKEYGVKESWTKMFSIGSEKFGRAVFVNLKNSLGNGVILVEADPLAYLYDLNKKEATRLPGWCFTWAFLGSLVSPTFGTCLGTQLDAGNLSTINIQRNRSNKFPAYDAVCRLSLKRKADLYEENLK